ncbi:2S albumin [Sesamum indicum]|uniref:2S albumin n=2 Tax=Sesamum indicum TaxID=4182 RepID=Q9AUD1_SESIN|nr:2S albumin [Sesamum indicum]AAK15088.1 2S albumin [Sesamum indicum]ACI41245.1 2S albumin [Sesamum indicum]
MAKKLALAAVLLVAMVALASATTYTTTVTTTAIDDEANQQSQQCRQQLQGRQFRSCQRYLSQGRSPYGGEEDEVLEMSTGNQQSEQSLRDCCQQLRNVDERCRCEAIRQAVRQQQQEGGYQEGQSQQVYQRARDLPRRCNMRPQQCQFRVIFV